MYSNKKLFCYLLATFGFSHFTLSEEKKSDPLEASRFKLGLKFDCLHDFNRNAGAAQNCLNLSGFRLLFTEKVHHQALASVLLNPFASLNVRYDKSPIDDSMPTVWDSRLKIIENYSLVWKPRNKLDIAFEMYSGATLVPDTSGLSFGSRLSDPGWKQSALSVTYHLPLLNGADVKFVAGNGEGEIESNIDPQQYFGFEFHGKIIDGLKFHGGASFDGNSSGSIQTVWALDKYSEDCAYSNSQELEGLGYSTSRISLAAELDGMLAFARGLRAGLYLHQSIRSDLDKDKMSQAALSDLDGCSQLDFDTLFVEDQSSQVANTMNTTVSGINASYRILDTYFFGFDYEKSKLSSDVNFIQACDEESSTACLNPSDAVNSLDQWAYTLGLGMDLNPDLTLSLAYHSESYGKLYRKTNYIGQNGILSKSRDLFNARISYRWD